MKSLIHMNEECSIRVNNKNYKIEIRQDRKLTWVIDANGTVWFNAPCSTTLKYFDPNKKQSITFYWEP